METNANTNSTPDLNRHFGLLHATALNVTMIVGAGVFITIPPMLKELPGPYAVLGWLAAGVLMLVDGLIWSELGATLPGSGGSYLYLLECYGRDRWGRFMAFLFIWQFLISGPLEIGSGLIALGQFSRSLSPQFAEFNREYSWALVLATWRDKNLAISIDPARIGAFLIGLFVLFLLYRRIRTLGRLTITFWVGVLAAIAWILIDGALNFHADVAFSTAEASPETPSFVLGLGGAMILAMYSYLGYYNICWIGDEVRDPGRTIPRAIQLSALLVCLLFVGLHLAMLGTVRWQEAKGMDNLPAAFMGRIHAPWAVTVVSLLLMWSCFGSAFAGLLGYSRIPYGAARYGHFFKVFERIHPVHRIPHVSLLVIGVLTLFWSFFDLEDVIFALITTRILEQFVGQVFGVILLRRRQPERVRPYKMWLYPLPCGVALIGWLYMYACAGWPFILLGLGTLGVGCIVFFVWSWWTGRWPFGEEITSAAPPGP